MHPFHYFTPGVLCAELAPGNRFDVAVLKRLHLEHLAELTERGQNPGLAFQDVSHCGKAGAMFTPGVGGAMAPVTSLLVGQQTWMPQGSVFIGWENADPPGPETQARPNRLTGLGVNDEAGQPWIIPIVRSPKGMSTLPNDIEWNVATGEPQSVRAKKFDELWEIAGQCYDYWNGERLDGRDVVWLQKQALKALQVNYRISPMELNAFRSMGRTVVDDNRAHLMTAILFDLDIIEQVTESKKN